ncbi:MAG TPA: hypothetical protein PKY56_04705 [Candidatus Kapabacteria bacterium]|nr:hypothetical protein [Candidatus Kapabacteria bacterium]HPO63084.1 hypothetical protein [Candidatus Kapabacteria bacterium]
MRRKFLFILLFSITLLFSCSTGSETYYIDLVDKQHKIKELKNIALLDVYISSPVLLTGTFLESGVYYNNYQDVFLDIDLIHKIYVDSMTNHLAKVIENYSDTKVLYGDSLYLSFTNEKLKEFDIKTYPFKLDNSDFPKLPHSKNGLNFFDFTYIGHIDFFFQPEILDNIQPQIKKICEALKVDGIVITYMTVVTYDYSILSSEGKRFLRCKMLYFDKDGKHIGTGKLHSQESSGYAEDISDYQNVLRQFFINTDDLMKVYYKKISKRKK